MQYKGEQNRPRLKTHIFGQVFIIGVLLSCLFILPAISYYSSRLILQSSGTIGLDWLHTEDKSIVDSYGNIVILRGANFMGYEFGAWTSHTEEDYARMADWGFNVVRLPIAWSYVEPEPGVFNTTYFEEYVDRDIRWASKHGIYIILDIHQYYWSPHFTYWSQTNERGNGLPVWSVGAYQNTIEGYMTAITDFWLGKGPNGTEVTAENHSMQDRFAKVWMEIAKRYSTEPTIAAYDLFNEPPRGTLSPDQHAQYLYPFYQNLICEIRKVSTSHIIIYEPTWGWSTLQAIPLNEPNSVLSFHFYIMRSDYSGNISDLERAFDRLWQPLANWEIPIWVGEFNTHADFCNSTLWIRDILSIFTKKQLGWAWWSYYRTDSYAAALCYSNGTQRSELKYVYSNLN